VYHEALGKWSVVMGAMRRHGEDFLFYPHRQNSFPLCVPNQHLTICQAFSGNALRKIRSDQFGLLLAQPSSPGKGWNYVSSGACANRPGLRVSLVCSILSRRDDRKFHQIYSYRNSHVGEIVERGRSKLCLG